MQRSLVAPWMQTEEREFPGRIPDILSLSLLISLERAVHLCVRSSAAVSWIKQLPRPTLKAAVSWGCLGSTGLCAPMLVPLIQQDAALPWAQSGWRDGAGPCQAILWSSFTLHSLVQRCLFSSFFFFLFFSLFFSFFFLFFFLLALWRLRYSEFFVWDYSFET